MTQAEFNKRMQAEIDRMVKQGVEDAEAEAVNKAEYMRSIGDADDNEGYWNDQGD